MNVTHLLNKTFAFQFICVLRPIIWNHITQVQDVCRLTRTSLQVFGLCGFPNRRMTLQKYIH